MPWKSATNSFVSCQRSEATQGRRHAAPGLLRRFAPRNDDPARSDATPEWATARHIRRACEAGTDAYERRRPSDLGPSDIDPDFPPSPIPTVMDFQNCVVEVFRIVDFTDVHEADRVLGEHFQNLSNQPGIQSRACPVEEDESRCRQQDVDERQDLLFAEGKERAPIPLHVQSARTVQNRIEIEFLQHALDLLVSYRVFASFAQQDVAQRTRRQIGPLGQKEQVFRAWTNNPSLAGGRNAGGRPEQGHLRSLVRTRDENSASKWD